MYTLGVDIGGTFTDFVLYSDKKGTVVLIKVQSTPIDQAKGVIDGIEELGCPLDEVKRIVHGTTVGTNAVIERKGAKIGLITTRGFKDLIEIGRTQRLVPNSMFRPKFIRPKPLVPRHLRFEVGERTHARGKVVKKIDQKQLDRVIESMEGEGLESIAVCFLHSYCNQENERFVGNYLREKLPLIPVSLSSEVVPEYREFERFSSATVNAYLTPVMMKYLDCLESDFEQNGYGKGLFVMNSSGGMLTSEVAQSFPIRTILSGPSGGVNGAIYFARQAEFSNIITYDMGGTSTDVCLVKNLVPAVSSEHRISGVPIKTLQMEINTVGAGGGSIAWVNKDGRLRLGPKSAGSDPGPASYAKGNTRPTITDANLFLGRLGSRSLLGGSLTLFPELAKESLQRLSEELNGLELHKLAEGILQIGITKMALSIKEISVERGHDPRNYVLVPYGGAGPMHAALIAEELGISTILVPRFPGNLSALGLIVSDIRHDDVVPLLIVLQELKNNEIEDKFHEMKEKAARVLVVEGFGSEKILFQRSLDLRYRGQAFELNIPVQEGNSLDEIMEKFHKRFQERYGHSHPEQKVELVNLRLSSFGVIDKPFLKPLELKRASFQYEKKDERKVFFQGAFWDTPIFERDFLPCGEILNGPIIIEESGATTVVPPDWMVRIDSYGNLILNRGS